MRSFYEFQKLMEQNPQITAPQAVTPQNPGGAGISPPMPPVDPALAQLQQIVPTLKDAGLKAKLAGLLNQQSAPQANQPKPPASPQPQAQMQPPAQPPQPMGQPQRPNQPVAGPQTLQ